MEIAGRVGRSEFLQTAEEDLRNNVRDRMNTHSVRGCVWWKREEMLTEECPGSRKGTLASSQGWCNLKTVSLKHLILFFVHLLCYFME